MWTPCLGPLNPIYSPPRGAYRGGVTNQGLGNLPVLTPSVLAWPSPLRTRRPRAPKQGCRHRRQPSRCARTEVRRYPPPAPSGAARCALHRSVDAGNMVGGTHFLIRPVGVADVLHADQDAQHKGRAGPFVKPPWHPPPTRCPQAGDVRMPSIDRPRLKRGASRRSPRAWLQGTVGLRARPVITESGQTFSD